MPYFAYFLISECLILHHSSEATTGTSMNFVAKVQYYFEIARRKNGFFSLSLKKILKQSFHHSIITRPVPDFYHGRNAYPRKSVTFTEIYPRKSVDFVWLYHRKSVTLQPKT